MTSPHPDLSSFNFQTMDIPPEVDNPPSPSSTHSETLSDLYGDEPEVPWVDAIVTSMPNLPDSGSPWFSGAIAYRTCYTNVGEARWGEFKSRFEEVALRRWRYEAGLGADPEGMLGHWMVFWVENESLEGASVQELRTNFNEDVEKHKSQHLYPAVNDFYLIDEEVVAALLHENPDEGEVPFFWVAHADPDIEPSAGGDPNQYDGHYKLPVEKACDFWELVSIGHMNMAGFAPEKKGGIGGAMFDTMYR